MAQVTCPRSRRVGDACGNGAAPPWPPPGIGLHHPGFRPSRKIEARRESPRQVAHQPGGGCGTRLRALPSLMNQGRRSALPVAAVFGVERSPVPLVPAAAPQATFTSSLRGPGTRHRTGSPGPWVRNTATPAPPPTRFAGRPHPLEGLVGGRPSGTPVAGTAESARWRSGDFFRSSPCPMDAL